MEKIGKYIIGILAVLVAVLSIEMDYVVRSKKEIEQKWKNAEENNKTYNDILSPSRGNDRALKLTVEQLTQSKDSILEELDNVRKELKIKDSKLKSLQYIASEFIKTDTVIIIDTIFKDESVNIDTLLYDEWYSVRLGLKYPSTVEVSPEFKSVKNIVVSAKKETVEPPKKFFLLRWFQKKHWVLNIDVIENSPYVKNQNNRYVEILR